MDTKTQTQNNYRFVLFSRRAGYLFGLASAAGAVALAAPGAWFYIVPAAAIVALFVGVPAALFGVVYWAIGHAVFDLHADGATLYLFLAYTAAFFSAELLMTFFMTGGALDAGDAHDKGGFRLGGLVLSAIGIYYSLSWPWLMSIPFYLLFVGYAALYGLYGWRYVKLGEQQPPWEGAKNAIDGGGDTRRPELAKPRYSFQDVVGMDDLKDRLETVGKRVLAKEQTGQAPRNGVLLFSEPGNGKSLIAEALAGELKANFVNISVGDIASRFVNQSTEQLVAAFQAAADAMPCVLFIDEIDAVLVKRENITQAESESGRLVNTFLTEMDKLRGSRVLVIGATNLIDRLDTAAVREGRFDFKIEVPPPDARAREAILEHGLERENERLVCDAETLVKVAARWSGFSAARLDACAREVADRAAADNKIEIGFDDWMAALRTVQGRRGKALAEGTPGLDEVVLAADAREALHGVAYRMTHPEQTERLGGTVPTGLLFFGPPGTGKTLTAQALAKETGWAFLPTNGTQLMADDKAIDNLIKEARDIRPVIVFIDEGDDILASREGFAMNGSRLNQLLAAMDGASGRAPDVLFIAATNRPEAIDSAALRGGRFSEKIKFDLPDATMLDAYLDIWSHHHAPRFAPDLDRAVLTRLLEGLAFANIAAVLQAAVNRMVSRGDPNGQVSTGDLKAARAVITDHT